jgi:hypothetical protein
MDGESLQTSGLGIPVFCIIFFHSLSSALPTFAIFFFRKTKSKQNKQKHIVSLLFVLETKVIATGCPLAKVIPLLTS